MNKLKFSPPLKLVLGPAAPLAPTSPLATDLELELIPCGKICNFLEPEKFNLIRCLWLYSKCPKLENKSKSLQT